MMRLTVHVEDAPFVEKERKLLGKDLQGKDIFKPKKSKCIGYFSFSSSFTSVAFTAAHFPIFWFRTIGKYHSLFW